MSKDNLNWLYEIELGDRHKKYTNLKKVSFPVREHIETIVPEHEIPEEFPSIVMTKRERLEFILGGITTALAIIGVFYLVSDLLGRI